MVEETSLEINTIPQAPIYCCECGTLLREGQKDWELFQVRKEGRWTWWDMYPTYVQALYMAYPIYAKKIEAILLPRSPERIAEVNDSMVTARKEFLRRKDEWRKWLRVGIWPSVPINDISILAEA